MNPLCEIESGAGAVWAQKAPEELQRALASVGEERRLESGSRLFSFGEAAEGVFLVATGKASAVLPGGAGNELVRQTAGPGALLGMASALCGKSYQFDVQARGQVEAVYVPVAQLNELLRLRPELGMQAMSMMCEELSALRQTREHLRSCENRQCGLYCQCKQAAEAIAPIAE